MLLAIFPPTTKPPEKNLVKIPYQRTLIEMFEDLHENIKASSPEIKDSKFTRLEIVDVFNNVTNMIEEDCKVCKKKFGKRCKCKKIMKVSKFIKSAGKKLEKQIGPGKNSVKKFRKHALSRTRKTLEALKKLPDNLVSFAERSSSIFQNTTRCSRYQDSVFLITGGWTVGGITSRKAEIYNPITNFGCSLPDLPDERRRHTQNENLLCGGREVFGPHTCRTWDPKSGTWNETHTLSIGRGGHVSWPTENGVYLLGGTTDGATLTDTVVLVTETGVDDASFRSKFVVYLFYIINSYFLD